MTEKNIFVYKLFLSLDISQFSLFLCKNSNLFPKQATPFSQPTQTPSKNQSPFFLKIWQEV